MLIVTQRRATRCAYWRRLDSSKRAKKDLEPLMNANKTVCWIRVYRRPSAAKYGVGPLRTNLSKHRERPLHELIEPAGPRALRPHDARGSRIQTHFPAFPLVELRERES